MNYGWFWLCQNPHSGICSIVLIDYLSLFSFQRSVINLHYFIIKYCRNWRLDYNNIMTTFMSTHFIIFFEVHFKPLSVLLHSLRNSRSNDCMHIIVQWKYNRNPQFSILQNLHFIFIFNYKPNNWFYTINHVQCSCNKELSAQIGFLLLAFTNMNITLL